MTNVFHCRDRCGRRACPPSFWRVAARSSFPTQRTAGTNSRISRRPTTTAAKRHTTFLPEAQLSTPYGKLVYRYAIILCAFGYLTAGTNSRINTRYDGAYRVSYVSEWCFAG